MKTKQFVVFLMVFALATLFTFSCKDEEEVVPNKEYVGNWKSKVYVPVLGNNTIYEQMEFVLTNTGFTGSIFQSKNRTDDTIVSIATSMKGILSNEADSILHVSITDVSAMGGPYQSISDTASFNPIWTAGTLQGLGDMLNTEFDATYKLYEGDSMLLTIETILPLPYPHNYIIRMLYKQ